MKTTISILLVLVLASSIQSQTAQPFMLGFAGNYPEYYTYPYSKYTHWEWYDELSINIWQGFGMSDKYPFMLDSCNRHNLWAFFNTDTIIWAAFGKMAIHQCEIGISDRFHYDNYWCGQNYDINGVQGRYFDINYNCGESAPPGTVLWNVHEKFIQSYANNDPMKEYPLHDSLDREVVNRGKWWIMPRMRIDSGIAHGTSQNVVRIVVIAYNGQDTVLNQVIKTGDFLDNQFHYNGRYLEEYKDIPMWVWADSLNRGRHEPYGNWSYWYDSTNCKVDYQIYWFGTVNVWIDNVKIMNRPAYLFFGNSQESKDLRNRIKRKTDSLFYHSNDTTMKGFYTEEIDYSDLTCMKALNDSLARWYNNSDKVHIYGLINYQTYSFCIRHHNGQEISDYITAIHPPYHMAIFYPFDGYCPNCNPQPGFLPQNVSFFDNDRYTQDIIDYETDGINAMHRSYGDYNILLQNKLQLTADTIYYQYNIARQNNVRFIAEPQVCQWKTDTLNEFQREPMNSELGAEYGIAICRGAQGFMPFEYQTGFAPANARISLPRTGYSLPDNASQGYPVFFYGMTDADINNWWGYQKRDHNFYGEPKWNYVRDLYAKIKTWGPILANSTNTSGFSVHRDGANHSNCIYDIMSIIPDSTGQNPCINDYQTSGIPNGPYLDCPNERYWEMGFFNPPASIGGSNTKYFMMVNRRCIPSTTNPSCAGDNRILRIKFNANYLPGFVNWVISDVTKPRTSVIFSKNYNGYVDLNTTTDSLGWFKPGEAKLFKLAPVPQKGGTLVADEEIEDANFTCEDTVWNDGYDIIITGSSEISFSDSATIIMDGGTFQSGDASGGPVSNKITYTSAVSGHKWEGLRFSDANVKIYNSEFLNIRSSQGSNYAISSIDCPLNDIRYNVFISSTDTAGGINIAYVNYSIFGSPPNSYVMYNTYTMNNSYSRAVQVQGFAGLTEGVYVTRNTMTSNGYATGIFLSTITGGVIKNNIISGFETAINTMSSTCDMYGNTIANSTIESKGVYAVESSNLNLAPSGTLWTGGMNNISNTKDNSINLDIDASNFILTGGANAFDLLSTAEEPYHLYGSFVSESYNSNATGNCFKLSGTEITDPDPPYNYLTNGYEQVTLDFIAYNCSQSVPECSDIVNIGNGLYDTIPRTCGGGGGESNSKLKIKNLSSSGSIGDEKFILTPKQLQDSIKIRMRHKNYSIVKNLCYELINNYPESIESISSLQTLYMATVLSDTTTSSRSALKAYYEGLILNHGNNQALVEISNYLVQKCKVLLRQYTSALAGFQAIINNNQYNYRGLLARWDYMATSLLMQGQGGSEKPIKNYEQRSEEPLGIVNSEAVVTYEELALLDGYDQLDDDKNPYSKEERAAIQKNVRTINERSKSIGEKRIETLEREAKQNNQRAKNELQRINSMKQVIKVEKPKNVIEHIKIVNNDIQIIFGSTLSNKSTAINNIPSVYRLAQNYPNPFNPVTTIKYELPKDSKVKLVVYDLLGREVKTLVNEIKTSGYYQIDFNMQNYASGVYFYKIEADDLSGKKFVDAKKMVLVK